MRIMYVDESGDPGCSKYASPHYILTGIIIEKSEWTKSLNNLKKLREGIKTQYGLKKSTEFHCNEIIRTSNPEYKKISKSNRIAMLRFYVESIPKALKNARIINICFDKSKYPNIDNFQNIAWCRLLARYNSFLKKSAKDHGIIVCDESNEKSLRTLLRKSRMYNPTPSLFGGVYNPKIDLILEDIIHRKSYLSYFVQTADVVSHLLYRKEFPKTALKKFNIDLLFNTLEPILLKEASKSDKLGVVRK